MNNNITSFDKEWVKDNVNFAFLVTKKSSKIIAYNKDIYYVKKSKNKISKDILCGRKINIDFSFVDDNIFGLFFSTDIKNKIYKQIKRYIESTMFLKDGEDINNNHNFSDSVIQELEKFDILDVFIFISYHYRDIQKYRKEILIKIKCAYLLKHIFVGKHLKIKTRFN